ncbi:alpha/beta hydrolase [Sphingomonas sp. LB3N6]|uniref:alpha/beta hydrolase n=1 Tax=Sphingomonas fucosidasi TaxID=3096164 RepID=UPI002FCC1B97
MNSGYRSTLADMGREIGPAMMRDVHALYDEAQRDLANRYPATETDVAYGPDPRQVMDLYRPSSTLGAGVPVLIFVHGGGFRRGAKRNPSHPFEAHMGSFAATHGMLGVVVNYRLAPDHVFPAGGEDVGLAVDWLREHAAARGGDPDRIVVIGTSAGAAHIATLLQIRASVPIAGAVLLSGLYGIEPYVDAERDLLYYGVDPAGHAATVSADALARTDTPLFVLCAEYDPPRFQAEFIGLLARFAALGRPLPPAMVAADHNHFSLAMHMGTQDTRVADAVLRFIDDRCAPITTGQTA